MAPENKQRSGRKIYNRLRNKSRLVVMNMDTFEERFSLVLSPLNVFTWGGLSLLLVIVLVIVLVAFTPLRELIPGYADVNTRNDAMRALFRADSLQQVKKTQDLYLSNLKLILSGQVPDSGMVTLESTEGIRWDTITATPSPEDSALRKEMETAIKYDIAFGDDEAQRAMSSYIFFTPMKGVVSSQFSLAEKHYGVDIIAPRNETVKATLDGTVIMATWTSETGHVIQVQHDNNLLSVYKHNSVLLREIGDKVKAGDPIAVIGESGELSSGPHLHFELWHDGTPINPEDYMVF